MQIQLNTDNHIEGSEKLIRLVENALGRFAERLTRVEIHLTDESGSAKSRGNDMRCVIEARAAGQQPITVSHDGTSLELALDGAADKMEKSLGRVFGILSDHKGRISFGGS